MIGLSIGNYKILEQLNGNEQFGVYKAVDMLLNRNVYIKIPVPNFMNQPGNVESFRFEAATLAKLVHPNIPTLHSLTTAGEQIFMITEFLEGETLDKILRRQGKLSCEKAVSIFTQVLDCLEFAHSAGITHGNLRADSIFLTETDNVKMLGFGTSKNLRLAETGDNILPELTPEDKSGAGKDIYAVGKMLFEVLTGENLTSDQIQEIERRLSVVTPVIPEKIVKAVSTIFLLQSYGKFQSAAVLNRELLSVDLNSNNLTKDTEFLGRAGTSIVADYSIDFSQDKNKFFKNAFKRSRKKARDTSKIAADAPVNWKLAKKNIWVGCAGILAIVALHFFFQFSFINNDAVQMVKELTKTKQVAEIKPVSEPLQVEEIEPFSEIDPFIKKIDDKTIEPAANYKAKAEPKKKKSETARKPENITPVVQPRLKTAPPRTIIRKQVPRETRAERLRRAEKALTGA